MLVRGTLIPLLDKKYAQYGTGGTLPTITAPTLSLTVIDDDSIKLSWNTTDTDHKYYSIQKSTDGVIFSDYDTSPISTIQYTVTNLDPETEYWFRIKSVGQLQTSDWSNEPSATTSAVVLVSPDVLNTSSNKLRITIGSFIT